MDSPMFLYTNSKVQEEQKADEGVTLSIPRVDHFLLRYKDHDLFGPSKST